MKKIILGIAVLAVIAVAAVNVNLSATQKSDMSLLTLTNIEALAECEDTVTREGGLIITTVCNRKTSLLDAILNIKCGTDATTTCSYSNVG